MDGCSKECVFCSFWVPKVQNTRSLNKPSIVGRREEGRKQDKEGGLFQGRKDPLFEGRRKEAGEGGRPVSRKEGSAF